MTFRELFKRALDEVDQTKKYGGRMAAINAFTTSLNEKIKEYVVASEWQNDFVINPYGKYDPYISLSAHGANKGIQFKVRLKKNGKSHSYFGDTTYYLPVDACTVDEKEMDEDVVTYLDFLYNTDDGVREGIEQEYKTEEVLSKYAGLLQAYKDIVTKLESIPIEERTEFRHVNLPTLNFW